MVATTFAYNFFMISTKQKNNKHQITIFILINS